MKIWLPFLLWALAGQVVAQDARGLVEAALQRYSPPPVLYQELALVMSDRAGRFSVRTLRHYGQHGKHVLVVETPMELRGALIRLDDLRADGDTLASPILGSDFLIGDFAPEALEAHAYERRADASFGRQLHYVIDALPRQSVPLGVPWPARRLYLRQDNLFIARVDHLDAAGQPARRQSFRDPRPDESGIWRPGMILMEDLRDGRRSVLKVERRIHWADAPPVGWMP